VTSPETCDCGQRQISGFYRALDSEWRRKGEQNNFVPVHSLIIASQPKGPSTLFRPQSETLSESTALIFSPFCIKVKGTLSSFFVPGK
ncbi:MAG: hypothetical protein PVH63_08635, partial [Balneolaceae bacterium]